MKELPVEFLKDKDQINLMRDVFREAQGNIIILTSAPTADVPLLRANEIGQYLNDIYWRVGQTIYKISSDSQIVVT